MRHLCVALTLHWLRARYTAFILRICTCQGGSSRCTRPSTWLRKRSVSPRTCGQSYCQEGQEGPAVRPASPEAHAHLTQLLALLLQQLQGSTAGLTLLHERENVAVEAGRGGEGLTSAGVGAQAVQR